MTDREIFTAALNKPQSQRISDARKNLAVILNYLTSLQDEGYGAVAAVALMSTFVAADGKVSAGEFRFVQDVLEGGIDYETFYNAAQAAIDTDQMTEMDRIMDSAPRDIKRAFVELCLDFISCDGRVTEEEMALFNKYLA